MGNVFRVHYTQFVLIYTLIASVQQKLKEEAERVKGKNGTLEADLSSLQEQLTSQTQDWSTDIKQWQDKVCHVHFHLLIDSYTY